MPLSPVSSHHSSSGSVRSQSGGESGRRCTGKDPSKGLSGPCMGNRPSHLNPGKQSPPTPSQLSSCRVYCELRPEIFIKPPKRKGWVRPRDFTCLPWLYSLPVALGLGSRFPCPHPIGISKLPTAVWGQGFKPTLGPGGGGRWQHLGLQVLPLAP